MPGTKSTMNAKKTLLAALVLFSTAPQAHATRFGLSYTLADGSRLTAVLDGTLQADSNTVVVDKVLAFAALDGVPGPPLPLVYGYDYALGQPTSPLPTMTLDGSLLDLIACADAACNDGFGFAVGDLFASTIGGDLYSAGASVGNTFEPFSAAGYTLEAMPEPASLPLLAMMSVAALAWQRRAASRRLRSSASNSNGGPRGPSGVLPVTSGAPPSMPAFSSDPGGNHHGQV
jgi:hypothetical protein